MLGEDGRIGFWRTDDSDLSICKELAGFVVPISNPIVEFGMHINI